MIRFCRSSWLAYLLLRCTSRAKFDALGAVAFIRCGKRHGTSPHADCRFLLPWRAHCCFAHSCGNAQLIAMFWLR
jgi:hypothetical protein